MGNTRTIQAVAPIDLAEKIDKLANSKEERRSFSAMMVILLEEALAARKEKK
jgi:hypothetical protein